MKNHFPIIIKGGYGLYNFGDDALMLAAYAIARNVFRADEIAFLCWEAPYFTHMIPEATIIPITDPDKKAHSDILLYGGGTQFYSFPLSRIRMRTIPGIKDVTPYLFHPVKLVKKALGRFNTKKKFVKRDLITHQRSAALGIGLGPFVPESIEEKRTQHIFKKMAFTAVRDPVSALICQNWGIHNYVLGADLCYLPHLWDIPDIHKDHIQSPKLNNIGVIVRDWKHSVEGMAYEDNLFQLVSVLRKNNRNVTYILFSKNDVNWTNRLQQKGENPIIWNPDTSSVNQFIEFLSGFDAFITARYHGAIFASLLGKPSLCIGIEPKLEIFAAELDGYSSVWPYPYDTSLGLELLQSFENSSDSLGAFLKFKADKAEQMAQKCIAFLNGG